MSADRSGDELGVTRQREDCLELATRRGWEVVTVLSENDTSAAGKVQRPKFEALLRGIDGGQFDVIVAWNLDRLTRNRPDTVRLIELGQEKRLTIALARGSDLDMATPIGRMMADQLAGWARYEIEQKSERQKRASVQRAVSGLPHKGRRAYGYESDGITIRDDEALVLAEIGQKFISGWSFTELAKWLNGQGHCTAMGNQFYSVAIRQMLMRKRYAGIREHDGVEYAATWPAIFNEDAWSRIQYMLRERAEKAGNKPKPRRALLTGAIWCGSCGAPMNGTTTYDRKTGAARKSYRCNRERKAEDGTRGCGKVSRGAVPLEWLVKEAICYRLDTPALAELLGGEQEQVTALLERRETLSARLTALLDDYTDGTLSKPEYKRAKLRATTALQAAERDLSALHASQDMESLLMAGESVRERWEAETDGWRRRLIDMLIERIDVQPGRSLPRMMIDGKTWYFDPKLIDIMWKH